MSSLLSHAGSTIYLFPPLINTERYCRPQRASTTRAVPGSTQCVIAICYVARDCIVRHARRRDRRPRFPTSGKPPVPQYQRTVRQHTARAASGQRANNLPPPSLPSHSGRPPQRPCARIGAPPGHARQRLRPPHHNFPSPQTAPTAPSSCSGAATRPTPAPQIQPAARLRSPPPPARPARP